ncbi:MAG: FkbM family methyltransferase [Bryobacterales bacterium]
MSRRITWGGEPLFSGASLRPAVCDAVPDALDVPATTLDDFFAGDSTPVDILRIDAEGSEPAILAGARDSLARSPDIKIILELSPALLRQGGHEPRNSSWNRSCTTVSRRKRSANGA